MTPRQAIAKGISALRALVAGGDLEAADAMAVLATLLVERRKPRDAASPGAKRMRDHRRRKGDPPASQGPSQAPSQTASQGASQTPSQAPPLSTLSPPDSLSLSESFSLPDPSEQIRSERARASVTSGVTTRENEAATAATRPRPIVPRATVDDDVPDTALVARMQKAYEAICHEGKPTLRPWEVSAKLGDLLKPLRARRPADPVGLFRELVERWHADLKARGHAPSLDWFARDFERWIDKPAKAPRVEPKRLIPIVDPKTLELPPADVETTEGGLELLRRAGLLRGKAVAAE